MIGTPAYMAPEVWDNKPVGPAADQYSLACVLFEMLTGRPLFEGDSPISILRAALSGPHFPAKWPEGVPERVAEVLGRALEGEPQRRYPTVGAFAEAVVELGRPAMVTEVLPAAQSAEEKEPISAEEQGVADEAAPANVGGAASAFPHPLPGAPVGRRRWVVTGIVAMVLLGVLALAVVGVLRLVSGGGVMAPEPVSLPTAAPKIGSTRVPEKDGMVQVFVPAREFEMGSEYGDDDEKPVHRVYLEDYWIDRTEVTHAMYRRCVTAQWCEPPSDMTFYNDSKYDQYPVIYVSWDEADAYCGWAGRRLPTEAEWEKAARGTDGRAYPWGNQEPSCLLANYESCGFGAQPVDSYTSGASPYGALDMFGNVWEWVQDWYGSDYYKTSPERNPTGPTNGDYKVVRGGSWNDDAYYLRSANRSYYLPDSRYLNVGFRCVVSAGK